MPTSQLLLPRPLVCGNGLHRNAGFVQIKKHSLAASFTTRCIHRGGADGIVSSSFAFVDSSKSVGVTTPRIIRDMPSQDEEDLPPPHPQQLTHNETISVTQILHDIQYDQPDMMNEEPTATTPPPPPPPTQEFVVAQPSVQTPSEETSKPQTTGRNGSHPDPQEAVAAALARAQEAVSYAESSLASVDQLPSAQVEGKWSGILKAARTAAIIVTTCLAMLASHAMGLWVQIASSLVGAMGIAWWGYSRSSLSISGAIAALVVGWGTLGCSLRFGATLIAFFFSSSKLTQYKEEYKVQLDDAAKAGGQRDWKQVLCNGGIPTLIALGYGILVGCIDVPLGPSPHSEVWRAKLATLLEGAFLGYYAACCGDTWASELGPLSTDTPRLITTMRPVRKGTNGGVTWLGLAASALGGAFVGAIFYASALVSPTLLVLEGQQGVAVRQWLLVLLGLAAGLTGSLIDSVLGATLQYTGFNRATGRVTSKPGPEVTHISGISFLDNNMVNTLSATLTAGLTALLALALFRFS